MKKKIIAMLLVLCITLTGVAITQTETAQAATPKWVNSYKKKLSRIQKKTRWGSEFMLVKMDNSKIPVLVVFKQFSESDYDGKYDRYDRMTFYKYKGGKVKQIGTFGIKDNRTYYKKGNKLIIKRDEYDSDMLDYTYFTDVFRLSKGKVKRVKYEMGGYRIPYYLKNNKKISKKKYNKETKIGKQLENEKMNDKEMRTRIFSKYE